MKKLALVALVGTFAMGGFFNNEALLAKKESAEAMRLCNVFKQKTQEYKKHMRHDELAQKTLESYIARENKFCKKAGLPIHG